MRVTERNAASLPGGYFLFNFSVGTIFQLIKSTTKALAYKVFNTGLHPGMPYILQKRIQFINGLSSFLIGFMVFLAIAGYLETQSVGLSLTFLSYWVVPISVLTLNNLGRHRLSRFLFIPLTTLYFTIANTVTHLTFMEAGYAPGILNLYMFRHYSPAALMALLILLDHKRETRLFLFSSAFSIFFVATFFIGMQDLGVNLDYLKNNDFGIGLNEFFLWTSTVVIFFEVIFLILINTKFENTFIQQNAELAAQKEEITAINDQLHEQKDAIESQKDVLEKVHYNLMSSINYAQRIQAALLPRRELMKEALPNHFILFKPRDVVSGDFYWASERGHKFFWVCADCTGHGVPGAFMTVIGMNLLHQIIMEESVDDPSTILLRLNRRLEQALRHNETTEKKVADGMDISIVVVDQKEKCFQFAGAKRPLLFIPKGQDLTTIKGSRFAIGGGNSQGKIFETHTFNYTPGDRIYMFSDGFPDQYGGEKDRKFMIKTFRETICNIQNLDLENQERHLEKVLGGWQGNTHQTDDILVMGMELGIPLKEPDSFMANPQLNSLDFTPTVG
ncbi:MAG TPA: hypothetical protein DCE41_32955 [Cytophagales bacterium]|nr:hypothetical protein [Cytophagales bacterium]HAA21825.1 hypothetical protein [Cytophagales bacterium]HAP62955.1 hypothetical protein [Cytophagales bacterium]